MISSSMHNSNLINKLGNAENSEEEHSLKTLELEKYTQILSTLQTSIVQKHRSIVTMSSFTFWFQIRAIVEENSFVWRQSSWNQLALWIPIEALLKRLRPSSTKINLKQNFEYLFASSHEREHFLPLASTVNSGGWNSRRNETYFNYWLGKLFLHSSWVSCNYGNYRGERRKKNCTFTFLSL